MPDGNDLTFLEAANNQWAYRAEHHTSPVPANYDRLANKRAEEER